MDAIYEIATLRFFLALIFLVAATSKLLALRSFRMAIATLSPFSYRFSKALSVVIPLIEMLAGLALVLIPAMAFPLLALIFLMSVFTIVITLNLMRGNRVACNCFGAASEDPISGWTIARNILLVLGLCLAWWLPAPRITASLDLLVPFLTAVMLFTTVALINTIVKVSIAMRRTSHT